LVEWEETSPFLPYDCGKGRDKTILPYDSGRGIDKFNPP